MKPVVLAILLAGCVTPSGKNLTPAPDAAESDPAVETEIRTLYAKGRQQDAVTFGRVVLMSRWETDGKLRRRDAAIGVRDKDGRCYFAIGWVKSVPDGTHVASYTFPGRSDVDCKNIY
jgi:hypothetical protein